MRLAPLLPLGLAVVAFGCSAASSTEVPAPQADGGPPADAAPSGEGAAAVSDAPSDAPPQPTGTCPAPIGAFAEAEYFHPPHKFTKGACTADEIAALTRPTGGSFPQRRTKVGATCSACVFSEVTDPEWGVVVVVGPDTGLSNYGACYATYGDTKCAKLSMAWRFCTRKACGQCGAGIGETCAQRELQQGQCKPYFDQDEQLCQTPPAQCSGDIFTLIENLCGP